MPQDTPLKVVVLDRQPSFYRTVQKLFSAEGYETLHAQDSSAALDALAGGDVHACVMDTSLPDTGGTDFIRTARELAPDAILVVAASTASLNSAVEAMRAGANDFFVQPVSADRLLSCIKVTKPAPEARVRPQRAARNANETASVDPMIGLSPRMLEIETLISRFGPTDAPVFITGETGTGKDVCAQHLHAASRRADAPFVALNCAAIPRELIESEIFGHVKGAYTGAASERAGAARRAHGGTLFLDEVCEMDFDLQAKLLRFLQTGTIKKVGSDRTEQVDVRIICATNRNPLDEVSARRFREDLYYRLNVLSLHMPPIRDRGRDVLLLAEHFLGLYARSDDRDAPQLTLSARQALIEHSWPGNIRELQNIMRRAVIMHRGGAIDAAELLGQFTTDSRPHPLRPRLESTHSAQPSQAHRFGGKELVLSVMRTFSDIERDIIEAVIEACEGSLPRAANVLGLSPSTIYRKRDAWNRDDDTVEADAPPLRLASG